MEAMFNNLFQGIFSELGGKALFEWGKEKLTEVHKDKKTHKEALEKAQSRVTDVFIELGDVKKNKLFQLHKKATKRDLRDNNDMVISDDNLVYLLGQLDTNRLKSTIRALNKLDEKVIIQFIELWHNYNNWEKFELLAKKCWGACCRFGESIPWDKLIKYLKEVKKKTKASLKEYDSGTDDAIKNVEKIFEGELCNEQMNQIPEEKWISKVLKKIAIYTKKLDDFYQENKVLATILGIIAAIVIILTIIALDYLFQWLPGTNILMDYLDQYKYFIGFCLGFSLVGWGLYFIISRIRKKVDNLLKGSAVLWMKSFRQVVKLITSISSLIGYPAIELGKLNNQLNEDSVKLLKTILDDIQDFLKKIAIFGTIVISLLLLTATFPGSITVAIILVIIVILSFAFMGITEPIVKPLEGKNNLRNVIKPISVALAIFGSILLLYAHGPGVFRAWLNPFTLYILFLIIMSFRSYHGKWISRSVRTIMTITILVLGISLLLHNNIFADSQPVVFAGNRVEDINNLFASSNYNDELDLHEITDSGYVYRLKNGKLIIDTSLQVKESQVVARGDNDIPYFKETLSEIYLANTESLFTEGPFYYPARFLTKLRIPEPKPEKPANENQKPEIETINKYHPPAEYKYLDGVKTIEAEDDITIVPYLIRKNQYFRIKTASGSDFYVKIKNAADKKEELVIRKSGHRFKCTKFDDVVQLKATVPGEKFIIFPS